MEKDKKVTALYCRLSKDDGSNSESLSIRTQKAMLMEYATRNGFGNCQYYVDDGYSGTNSDRPAFQELLDDIREGKVATVITKDQSRLGRNHIETGTYMEIFFPEHGVRYIAINDGYDSNEQSQMDIAPFRNIINEMYAKDTSRKIKSALRTRKKSGKYISSGAPFGYQKDPADHNHLVIDPNTAPVVEYIYSMAEEGLGLHRIAKRLHDEKVLKPCCNGVQREHNKKLNNGLPILHKVPPKRDYGRYFCIMAEKGGTSHGGLTEKLSLFFHAKKQEVNAYGR